jgi:hypothetical protein
VPSWIPGPVNGTAPEIYAGGGSYSIYFYAGPSFLFISGVAGGGFPGGSEANLNVELSVNANVQGWPAIQDIGIPAGTPTPIYDKVMWIADGVFYTVSGNGLDTDSLTLANGSVALGAPAPAEPAPAPAEPAPEIPDPVAPDTTVEQPANTNAPGSQQSESDTTVPSADTTTAPAADTAPVSSSTTTDASDTGSTETTAPAPASTAPAPASTAPSGSSDGTSGPWFTGGLNTDPSDGTDGANPPFLGDDGTGGAP